MSPSHDPNAEIRTGLFYAIAGYVLWGLTPIFWRGLSDVSVWEITAHRMFWTAVCMAFFVRYHKPISAVIWALRNPKLCATLLLTACLVTFNWGLMVWCVLTERLLQASLGYYMNALVAVFLGVTLLGETLTPLRRVALVLAVVALGVQGLQFDHFPFVAPMLAFSFGFYGYFRKTANIGAVDGLFAEGLLLLPLTLPAVLFFTLSGTGDFLAGDEQMTLFLILSGPVSALPLALFAAGAKRVRLTTMGFLQYIGPSIQFLLAVFIYGEVFTTLHAVTFGCVWAALALLTADGARGHFNAWRAAR